MPFVINSCFPNNRYGSLETDLEIDLTLTYLCTGKTEFDHSSIKNLDQKLGVDTEGSLTEIEDLEYDAFKEENFPGNYIFLLKKVIESIQNTPFRDELDNLFKEARRHLSPNDDSGMLKSWWKEHGKGQQHALKKILENYRDIQLDWHFRDEPSRSFWKYYEGMKLLLDCLAFNSLVSFELRRKIENRILLPISEIRNLK
ncbi:MAG: hypothetical protein F6K00_01240 [Leptolyngbya sp. SIOISBB]|nr:hypothetical protein [Leptolyngbya sp. SIOISBB]